MEMRECNNCGAKVLFDVCTQCLRETVKGLEAELKQSNEQFEVMPAGKDRNMVDGRIELITAHIKFRQELDDEISKAALEAESEMAEVQKLKIASVGINARESERDLVLGEAKYKKDNEIRMLAIEKLSGDWYAHIAKMERSFNERYVYENNPATPEQLRELRDKCESLEKKFTEFRAVFDAEKDAHKKRIPEMEAAYRNWMDAKEAELARLGDELEKLEAPDIAGRKEMEIKSLKIAEEVEVRKQLEIRETGLAEIMFEQKEMEQDQLKMEWFEACEVLKMLEEREGQGGGQQG